MADAKVSALGAITAALGTDEIYIVDDAVGTPVSKKITVGDLLSMNFGMIYSTGGSGTQTPGTSYVKLTQFDSDGLSSASITPDAASHKITVANDGIYFVMFQVSFEGSNSEPVMMRVYWNSVAQTHMTFRRVLGAGGDCGSASIMGVIDATSGATDFEVYVKTDAGSKTVDVKEAQLTVFRVANT